MNISKMLEHIANRGMREGRETPFTKEDLAHAVMIFNTISINLAYEFASRNGVSAEEFGRRFEQFGKDTRQRLIDFTGIDIIETWNNPLDSEIIEN